MKKRISRRSFLKRTAVAAAAASLPLSLVEFSWGSGSSQNFTFAYISDSHLTHIKGAEFVRNFDKGLKKAVMECNFMSPKPDFVVYGGDLAQLGKREELDHGMEIMSGLRHPLKWVIGEHDYYLDLGKYWQDHMGKLNYSFEHKGVHFVVLNSILTYETWIKKWKTPQERMSNMARLDNPNGSPFMVGDKQIAWMKKDLSGISKDTPVVVMSHSPLYKIFKPWNFWTDDAEKVQAVLKPFKQVTVLHGHVHQIMYNQIGNITFEAMMSTSWPWPYPVSYVKQPNQVPKLTVMMNRADPFHERDATGWSILNLDSGRVTNHYKLWENTDRVVKFDPKLGYPVDTKYQAPENRIPPQEHY
ncbi:MAG: serine/threonine protein phosphatase [Thermodesulfatator sp.]|nr:MAG: serine/threonine protein phosphatase [Thermodesulfatator sp.]